MADTALTIITDALLDLGVLAEDETPTAIQAVGALRKLNNMIDSWNLKSLNVYGATATIIPLVANQAIYTLNQSGNVQSASVRDISQSPSQIMDLPIAIYSDSQWQDIAFKSQTANYPYFGVWINPVGNTQQVYVNPIPTASNFNLVLWVSTLLSNLSQTTEIVFAPGYKRALTLALTMELAPGYEVQPSELTVRQASDALDAIRTRNIDIPPIKSVMDGPYWDYRNGMWKSR